ncbi:MAG: ATP-binding cassette domain-containing protein [Methanocalculus sp.]|uniref:ABC transporter ATP-binding protein n=1 Tax=Methanocalculus sp. TaxID=2004547 RepID=UPI0027238D02|nr:ATP-binding cassette domain-containing protein [Methanocalculus sp.]MDO9539791.1 ATP-binding cassette domain-containing protein [Methanocalculus sp.]
MKEAEHQEDAIIATDLRKVFSEIIAVDSISFKVHKGEIFGLLGPNGAGKTTTVRMLTGVMRPDGGSALIFGHDSVHTPIHAKQRCGIVPETANAYTDLSAWQNLMLMGELYGVPKHYAEERAASLLKALGLLERKDQKVQGFSKGMKQRLILAMALLHEPDLLYLDEPTSGLDVQSTQLITGMLRELNRNGITIFLTTHNMEEANRLCDRVAIMRRGKIVAIDAPERLKMAIDRLHTIEISFNQPLEAGDLSLLPAITTGRREGDKWLLTTGDVDCAIRSLTEYSMQHQLKIETLRTLAPTLDEVFLRLTEEESA